MRGGPGGLIRGWGPERGGLGGLIRGWGPERGVPGGSFGAGVPRGGAQGVPGGPIRGWGPERGVPGVSFGAGLPKGGSLTVSNGKVLGSPKHTKIFKKTCCLLVTVRYFDSAHTHVTAKATIQIIIGDGFKLLRCQCPFNVLCQPIYLYNVYIYDYAFLVLKKPARFNAGLGMSPSPASQEAWELALRSKVPLH